MTEKCFRRDAAKEVYKTRRKVVCLLCNAPKLFVTNVNNLLGNEILAKQFRVQFSIFRDKCHIQNDINCSILKI